MKIHFSAIAIGSVVAAQIACAAPTPLEVHQRMFDHLKAVRDLLVPAPVVEFVESFPPIAIPRGKILQLARLDADADAVEVQAPPPVLPGAPVDPSGIADWAEGFAVSTTQGVLDQFFPRGSAGGARRPVIVGGDVKNHATLAEDLTVMGRILEKAAGAKSDGPPTAAGIPLLSFGQPNSPRAFYLEGYGAMFMLNVKFPLVAPPKPDDAGHTNDNANSEWEKARDEVYGRRTVSDDVKFRPAPGEEFNSQRVDTLKTQIIDDLVNAKNIRHLKPEDSVTVVVLGGGPRGAVTRRIESRSPARAGARAGAGMAAVEMNSFNVESGASQQSTMTLRVKKSDIDALAQGQLSADEFEKKVAVQVY